MNYSNVIVVLALALGVIGFAFAGMVAYLQYQINNDLVYTGILAVVPIVLGIMFFQNRKVFIGDKNE